MRGFSPEGVPRSRAVFLSLACFEGVQGYTAQLKGAAMSSCLLSCEPRAAVALSKFERCWFLLSRRALL